MLVKYMPEPAYPLEYSLSFSAGGYCRAGTKCAIRRSSALKVDGSEYTTSGECA